MKSTKFSFFLIFFLISFMGINELKSQHFKCGTPPPTEAQRAEIIRRLRLNDASRNTGCTDPVNNSTKTYKLILEYAVKNGVHFLSQSDKTNIENHLNSTFSTVNVSFQISYWPVMCDNCDLYDKGNWGRDNPLDNNIDFKDCLWGRLTAGNVDGGGGVGNYEGRFVSTKDLSTIAHELGHALGLRHTFDNFSDVNSQNNENVFQDNRAGCPCNCRLKGDYICDTQVDPYVFRNDNWNTQMFNSAPYLAGTLTANNPTMNRVNSFSPGNCILSSLNTNVYHVATEFAVSATGSYTFNSTLFAGSGSGGSLYLYEDSFNPSTPCANLLQIAVGTDNLIRILTAGVNYILVVAANVNGDVGNYRVKMDPIAGQIISSAKTTQLGLINLDDIQDQCGTIYSKLNINENQVLNNLMSYHNQSNLTPGQGSFIKLWNLGKPWETSGSAPPNAGPGMDPGFVVNSPMTISSPMNLTGDIIVNSHLTISNTVLGFMQDKGIIINAGGAITVDNSHLIPYSGAGCFPQAQYWKGIEVKTPSKVRIMIKNNSVIDRAFTAIKGHNCNIEGYIITGSRINSYNYTSLDILNNAGYFQVIERCIINGKIAFENSIDGLRISSSSVTGPLFKVKSATLTILGSKIYSPLEIENMGSHTVRLYNSTFFNFVNANPLNGKGVVRDNTFNTSVNTFFNTLDLDMYNNTFEGNDGPTILGFRPINVLLFKNSMSSARYGIQNANFFSNTRIECNNFLTQGTNDLFLREPIATFQGNLSLAAGNSFSRTPNLEVNYSGGPEIKYHFRDNNTEEPLRITPISNFSPIRIDNKLPSACDIKYPDTPPIPDHCNNEIKDGDETGVDCGGSCPRYPDTPVIITPSNCINGIQDQGETGIDCGGPCPPCLVSCSNGIQDNGEYGVDCGGPCPPCVSSTPPTCTDGIMNGNESGIDCGGSCPPCGYYPPIGGSSGGNGETGGSSGKYTKGDHTAFIQQLNAIYGSGFMTGARYQVSQDFAQHQATLDGGNTCAVRVFITSQSASQPAKVLEMLTAISPNVSPAVIHALFEKSPHFTSSQVAQILALNPALLTDAYVSGVVYKTNTFGTTDKNIILNAASANSSRVNTEVMLSYKKQYQDAIIRDNIGMLSLNTPIDFNDIRAELATNPSPYRIFDIAQTYADQGRPDLAAETLTGADLCQITNPIYRSQLTGLSYIYSNWQGIQDAKSSSRSDLGTMVNDLITHEHGIATDIAAQVSSAEVKLKERWKYEPLVFATPSSNIDLLTYDVEVYPNPAHDILYINIKGTVGYKALTATIINIDGKVMSTSSVDRDNNPLDISSLSPGIYTAKVMNDNQVVFVSKFIKIQ